jgi:hypothetical protein
MQQLGKGICWLRKSRTSRSDSPLYSSFMQSDDEEQKAASTTTPKWISSRGVIPPLSQIMSPHSRASSNGSQSSNSSAIETIPLASTAVNQLAPISDRSARKLKLKAPSSNIKNDFELVTILASKLNACEKELTHSKELHKSKDAVIQRLQIRIEKLKLDLDGEDPVYVEHLESKCTSLEARVTELEDQLCRFKTVPLTPIADSFPFDVESLKQSLIELNQMAGEGISQVVSQHGASSLKVHDSLPLSVYRNGIFFMGVHYHLLRVLSVHLIKIKLQLTFFKILLMDISPPN